MEKKKIGLLGAILMGIGCIVGSGIFGTLPTVANGYGAGVVWALIGAAAVVVLRALASTYSSAALPASGSQFLWAAKLMHPIAGAFVSFSTLLMPTNILCEKRRQRLWHKVFEMRRQNMLHFASPY